MRNSDEGGARAREEDEDDDDGEGEGEEFYESLDRILSSSCSSTSASDDDGDHHPRHYHRQHGHQHRRAPRFPAASMYDVWISQPFSVEERRRRLLQQMGLLGDPYLSRGKPAGREDGDSGGGGGCVEAAAEGAARQVEMGRSVSCDGIFRRQDLQPNSSLSAMGRSRSDGAMDADTPGGCCTLPIPLLHKQHPSPNKPPIAKSPSSGANTNDSYEDSDGGGEDGCENRYHRHGNSDLYCRIKNRGKTTTGLAVAPEGSDGGGGACIAGGSGDGGGERWKSATVP